MNLLRGPRPMTPYDGQFLRDRLRGKEYLTTAYFAGATPQNSYTPTQPYVLNVLPDPRPQDIEPGYLRLLISTPGADAPRPTSYGRSPPPASGSCGNIPALSAASASPQPRTPGRKP